MPSVFIAAAKFDTPEIIVIVAAAILALPLLYAVHCALNYCCLRHARRFCRKNGPSVSRWRFGPAFDQSGIKTEFTLVEVDCLDSQRQRRLIRLVVWIGIRKVLNNENYPASHDEKSNY